MEETRARITREGIRIYEDADFVGMREAGRQVAEILDLCGPLVKPGVTTAEIDDFIRAEVERRLSATRKGPEPVEVPPSEAATAAAIAATAQGDAVVTAPGLGGQPAPDSN